MKSKVHSIVVIFLFIATTFTVTGNPKISRDWELDKAVRSLPTISFT